MDRQQQVRDFLENTIKEKGFSLNSLSLKIGKNSTYLFHFIKRNSPRRLDETARRQLAQILDVAEQDLCDFTLPTSVIPDKLSTLSNFFSFGKNQTNDLVSIDVLDMAGPYKGRFEQIKKNIIGKHFLSKDLLTEYSSAQAEDLKIVKFIGDTMLPTIASGDLLWIDMSYNFPSSDGIYILNTNGDTVVRRLQINPFDSSIEVSADNKAYKSYNISDCKNLNICGKVISITHKLG